MKIEYLSAGHHYWVDPVNVDCEYMRDFEPMEAILRYTSGPRAVVVFKGDAYKYEVHIDPARMHSTKLEALRVTMERIHKQNTDIGKAMKLNLRKNQHITSLIMEEEAKEKALSKVGAAGKLNVSSGMGSLPAIVGDPTASLVVDVDARQSTGA